jgi:tRNA(Ile2)-agmatinylcytidine synthase
MCTTYLVAVLIDEIKRMGMELVGFPRLIRLNPNCPYKTRGNAALSFRVSVSSQRISEMKDLVLGRVESMAMMDEASTDPGVAFFEGEEVPEVLSKFSSKVVREMVSMKEAIEVAKDARVEIHRYKFGRGIIGALAAIGNALEHGRSYELVAYRTAPFIGTRREMDAQSIIDMDKATYPYTFDNLDYNTGEIRIMPHTPCPVYFGIRGYSPEHLQRALGMVKPLQPVERYVVYETNQGTDAHISDALANEVKPLTSVKLLGTVSSMPVTIRGGHVIFEIKDETGSIHCAVYEPTHGFREVARALVPGDKVRVYGAAKKKPRLPLTINVEKIEVIGLVRLVQTRNPVCPRCGHTMKSEGKDKGYQCPKCKFKSKCVRPVEVSVERKISPGLYAAPPRARRHLSKPTTPVYVL